MYLREKYKVASADVKGPLAGNNPKEIFSTCRKIYIRKLIRDMLSGPYHIIPIKMTIR